MPQNTNIKKPQLQVATFKSNESGKGLITATLGGVEIFSSLFPFSKYNTTEKEQNLIVFVAHQIKAIIENKDSRQANNLYAELKTRLN